MLKRFSFLAILAFLAFAYVSPVRAEETIRITTMSIYVWPEYDQPGVLVQYQGVIAGTADKNNPREINFLVPKGAGVGATCAIKSDGNHTSETWKESDAGEGFVQITYKLTEPRFHVEYYYNPLVGAPDRKMDFVYKAVAPADQVELAVQHPLKATNFVLTPDTPDTHKDNDGFTYHSYTFKQVSVGQRLATSIAYTKDDPSPSVTGQKQNTTSASASSENNSNLNAAIVVGIFLGGIGIAGLFFLQRNMRRAQPYGVRERPRAPGQATGGFCTQCGNAMEAKDKFCARCGSPRSA